ncbi:hypothetical protein NKR19_g10167, partial [Coniochaeta hoffmannii]
MDGPPPPGRRASRPPIHHLPLPALLVVPFLLAAATVALLFVHAEPINIPLLWSQCHARSRAAWLSRIPVLGTPSCFLVSFFKEAVASTRGRVVVGEVAGFVGGL